jgi:AdoMet-dependent heme synthase
MFLPRYPMHVVFVMSNRCNLRCIHCSSAAGEAAPGELARDEIEGVLDQLAGIGVIDVALSGRCCDAI